MDHAFKSPKPRDRNKSHWGADQTRAAREAIVKRDGPNCWICGLPFAFQEKPTLDHVIPKSKGGSHRIANLKLAHYSCNTKRGNAVTNTRGVAPHVLRRNEQ